MNAICSLFSGTARQQKKSKNIFSVSKSSNLMRRSILAIMILGLLMVSAVEALAATYYSQGSLPVNVPASWNTGSSGGGSSPSGFTGTHTWIIQPGHAMTMTGTWTVGSTATVRIDGSIAVSDVYRIIITGTLTVNGRLINSGTFSTSSAITASSGITVNGIYEHARDGGYLPTATWSANSTCLISGWTSTATLGNVSFNQPFYNFTWNCPDQQSDVSFAGRVSSVSGTFTLENSGIYLIRPGGNPSYGNYVQTGGIYTLSEALYNRTIEISGDFTLEDGTFNTDGGRIGTVNITGDLHMSGGFLNMNSENYRNQYLNVEGDVSFTGGELAMSSGTGIGYLTIGRKFLKYFGVSHC